MIERRVEALPTTLPPSFRLACAVKASTWPSSVARPKYNWIKILDGLDRPACRRRGQARGLVFVTDPETFVTTVRRSTPEESGDQRPEESGEQIGQCQAIERPIHAQIEFA